MDAVDSLRIQYPTWRTSLSIGTKQFS
jgi:hypothetical protein